MMTSSNLADALMSYCGVYAPVLSFPLSATILGKKEVGELRYLLDQAPLTASEAACILSFFVVGA